MIKYILMFGKVGTLFGDWDGPKMKFEIGFELLCLQSSLGSGTCILLGQAGLVMSSNNLES